MERLKQFVNEHLGEDPAALLLQRNRYPDVDIEQAVRQIEGKRQATIKWPSLACFDDFLFPPRISREQSSSEATAKFKSLIAARLLEGTLNPVVADLTGGMGIDTLWLAGITDSIVHYVEQSEELCRLMEHNRIALHRENVSVHCTDSMGWIADCGDTMDLIFIDPARRDDRGRKVAAFEDCQPNIIQYRRLLDDRCRYLIVKASPMIDINLAIGQLGSVDEVHILSVKDECKEVLFVCGGNSVETQMVCTELADEKKTFRFTRREEVEAHALLCEKTGKFLFIPSAGLMKAGAFNLVGQQYGLLKLARNSHIYTSDILCEDFPGRTFEVICEIRLDRKSVAGVLPEGKAHVLTRNFPTAAAALQKQLGLNEGGDKFIVATTIGNRKIGLLCSPRHKQ